ncbi:ArdC family protein [Marinobacter salinexigens]|nr:zincin-like metallopeptidase domain-containing protein [Marinobacter salinexigens]
MSTTTESNSPKLSRPQEKLLSNIIHQMESVTGDWEMPWHNLGKSGTPQNIYSAKNYRGFNKLVLMLKQSEMGYTTPNWGTLRQWNSRRSKVLAGEKAVTLFYPVFRYDKRGNEHLAYFRPFWVFNGNQVSNYNPDHPDLFDGMGLNNDFVLPSVDELIRARKISLSFGGMSAYYNFVQDRISIPAKKKFVGSSTSTANEAFHATLLHEMVHWTGHKSRLNRPHHQHWGDDVYAFEELIAEIGAAFICCDYNITNAPREDHAKYLKSWLRSLNEDMSLLWTAASQAQKAVDYLIGQKEKAPEHDHEEPTDFALEMQPTQSDLFY